MAGKNQFVVSYFGVLLSLAFVCSAAIWVAYSILPHSFYLPFSLAVIGLAGLVAFVILIKRVNL